MVLLETTKHGDNLLHPSKFRCLHVHSPSPADPLSGAYQTVSTVVNETVYSYQCNHVVRSMCSVPAVMAERCASQVLGLLEGLETKVSRPRVTFLQICVACQRGKLSGSYLTVSTVVDINVHSCYRRKCPALRTFAPGVVRTWSTAQATKQNQRVTVRNDATGGQRKVMVRSRRGVPCGGVGDQSRNDRS